MELDTGHRIWEQAGVLPLALTDEGDLLARGVPSGLLLLDAKTEAETLISEFQPFGTTVAMAGSIQGGRIILSDATGLTVLSLEGGSPLWKWQAQGLVVDLPSIRAGRAAIATADRAVVLVQLPLTELAMKPPGRPSKE